MKIKVWFTTRPEDLGSVLIDLAGRVVDLNYEVEITAPHDKNRPRGSAGETMLEIIQKAPGVNGADVRDAFAGRGFKRSGAQSAIEQLIKKALVKRKKVRGKKGYSYYAVKSNG